MPRYNHHQLRWSEKAQAYLLRINGDGESGEGLPTAGWLDQISSFSFHSRSGMQFTARKQRVQRGSLYWYAYRRLDGRLAKHYLGRTEDLSLVRLEEVATLLESKAASSQAAFPPPRPTVFPRSEPGLAQLEEPLNLSSVEASALPPLEPAPLLLSKLAPPRLHAFLLDRPRLFRLLDSGRAGRMTLLSAPAGFGKTTLLCQWLRARRENPDFPPVAWLSLEESDNDLVRFWRYLIAACQAFKLEQVQVEAALLETAPRPPLVQPSLEKMLITLLNALALCPAGGILVLEDFGLITTPQIHKTLSFFLDHLPENIHLILLTRSDQPFSLAQLRAEGDLYELRASDLRFSEDEVALLFNDSLSIPLPEETLRSLHHLMEGWGAGLHLARLALQRATSLAEVGENLARLSSNDASFQEYFVSQVFELQAEPVQRFLLQTSFLKRLTGALCDAVTGQPNSQELLRQLGEAGLFLEPQDPGGQWFRYHRLFSQAMQNEALRRLGEAQLHELARRAACWYEEHGFTGEAIEMALYARDYERAAKLVESFIEAQSSPGEPLEQATLLGWREQIPQTVLKDYPSLCLDYAKTLLFMSASWQPTKATLELVEKLLLFAREGFSREKDHAKMGELLAFRSLLAWRSDDSGRAGEYARQALAWLSPTRQVWRCLCLCLVGKDWLEKGRFKEARQVLVEALALAEKAENRYFKRMGGVLLARLCYEQGEVHQATRLYRQALASAREEGHTEALCYALTGLAVLAYESNELEKAYRQAQEVINLREGGGPQVHLVNATLIQARVLEARGEASASRARLEALLESLPATAQPSLLEQVQIAQARLALAEGDLTVWQGWGAGQEPRLDFSQRLEAELLAARFLRAQEKPAEAGQELERLVGLAREAGNRRLLLYIMVEMALLLAGNPKKAEAQALLLEVLEEADGNYLRLFLDAGNRMALLLRSLLPRLRAHPALLAFVRTLLEAFPAPKAAGEETRAAYLFEPLTPQELRVLRLLARHRSNPEIARELVVSINTVRSQVQSIYQKLGVHKRSAAVEAARDLHLL